MECILYVCGKNSEVIHWKEAGRIAVRVTPAYSFNKVTREYTAGFDTLAGQGPTRSSARASLAEALSLLFHGHAHPKTGAFSPDELFRPPEWKRRVISEKTAARRMSGWNSRRDIIVKIGDNT